MLPVWSQCDSTLIRILKCVFLRLSCRCTCNINVAVQSKPLIPKMSNPIVL